jgi:flagellar biogenesis protein FliO
MNLADWTGRRNWIYVLLALTLGGVGTMLGLESTDPLAGGIRAGAALLLVIGIAYLGAQGFKKWSTRTGAMTAASTVPINVIGARGLGDGKSLLVVEVAEERLLLGAGREGIVFLTQLSSREDGFKETSKREDRS